MKEDLIPKPKSKFIKVRCNDCKTESIIFSKAAGVIECSECGEKLAIPTGGEIEVKARILEVLD